MASQKTMLVALVQQQTEATNLRRDIESAKQAVRDMSEIVKKILDKMRQPPAPTETEEEARPLCSATKNSKHLLFTELVWNGHQFRALVDSGCGINIIHPRLVNNHDIPWIDKETPYQVNTIDGKPIQYDGGEIRRETAELPVLIHGHTDKVTFDLIDTNYDMVLGRPWLKASNPKIDWSTNQLSWDEPEKKDPVPQHRLNSDSYGSK